MFSQTERARLRDVIARTAAERKIPNPLVTSDEYDIEGFALLNFALARKAIKSGEFLCVTCEQWNKPGTGCGCTRRALAA